MRGLKLASILILTIFLMGSLGSSSQPIPSIIDKTEIEGTPTREMVGGSGSPYDVWERQFALKQFATLTDITPALGFYAYSFTTQYELFDVTGTGATGNQKWWQLSLQDNSNVSWYFNLQVDRPSGASAYSRLRLTLNDPILGYLGAGYENWHGRLDFSFSYSTVSGKRFTITSYNTTGTSIIYNQSFNWDRFGFYRVIYTPVNITAFNFLVYNAVTEVFSINQTIDLGINFDLRGISGIGFGLDLYSANSSVCLVGMRELWPVNLYNTKVGSSSRSGCSIMWEEFTSTCLLYGFSGAGAYYRKWINYTYTSTFLTINAMTFYLNLFISGERFTSSYTFYGDNRLFLKTSISESERGIIGSNVAYRTQFQIWNSSNVRVLNQTMEFLCWANESVFPFIMAWIYHDPSNPSVMTEQIQYGYLYYRETDDLWIYVIFETLHLADTLRFNHLSQYIEYTSSTVGMISVLILGFENRLKNIQQMTPDPMSSQGILNYKGVSEQLGYSTESVDYTVWVAETFKQSMETWGERLILAFEALSMAIGVGVGSIIAGLSGGFDSVILGLGNLLAGITIAFANVITFFGDFLAAIVSGDIWTAIGTVLGSFAAALAGFGQFMVDIITAIPDFVVGFASLIQVAIGFIVQALAMVAGVIIMVIPWIAMIIVFDLIAYTVKMAEGEGPGVLLDWAMRYVHILSFVFNIIATVVRNVIHVVQMVVNIV